MEGREVAAESLPANSNFNLVGSDKALSGFLAEHLPGPALRPLCSLTLGPWEPGRLRSTPIPPTCPGSTLSLSGPPALLWEAWKVPEHVHPKCGQIDKGRGPGQGGWSQASGASAGAPCTTSTAPSQGLDASSPQAGSQG